MGFADLLTADCLDQVSYKYECRPYSVFYLDTNGDFINDQDELLEVSEADYAVTLPTNLAFFEVIKIVSFKDD